MDTGGAIGLKEPDAMGYTYAGVGLYSPRFFSGHSQGKLALRPLLDGAIKAGCVSGEYYAGEWVDVGTPERLKTLDEAVKGLAPIPFFQSLHRAVWHLRHRGGLRVNRAIQPVQDCRQNLVLVDACHLLSPGAIYQCVQCNSLVL